MEQKEKIKNLKSHKFFYLYCDILKQKDKEFNLQKILDCFLCQDVNNLTPCNFEKLVLILYIKVLLTELKQRDNTFNCEKFFDYFLLEIVQDSRIEEIGAIIKIINTKLNNVNKKIKKEI